ncbi:Crp/Fnr family transcriptional regulator [Phenylobacterium terrae]|uniref:Crp/Fnr family transcriptional regulator n=1 Tax=Phenylobacterium terrae TaxID=2665495 RepID=A0ABW4N5A7_9CAUL
MGLDNRFLDSLPPEEIARLEPALRRHTLTRDQLIAETGHPVPHAVFPIDCVISVVAVMHDGRQIETRTIGRESGYGLLHALGSRHSYERVTAQIGGEAWRLPIDTLAAAAAASPLLVRRIVQRAQATLVQTAQSTACNSLHSAEQRLCRWLLLTRDRLSSEVLPLTQEHLSIMLGVQRTTVTAVASELQASGAIAYSRGRITVLDAEALQRRSCECYEAIKDAAAELLRDGRD